MDVPRSKEGPEHGASGSWATALSTVPTLLLLGKKWLQGSPYKHSNSSKGAIQVNLGDRGVSLSMERQRGATVPKMLLGPRGTCLEERDPPLLPGPGRLLILCPQLPPNTLAQHRLQRPRSTGRRSRGTPLTNSPLEFWELLFVSSKWFCALPSTRRLKALSAGWGRGESKKKKTTVTGQYQVQRGGMPERGRLGGQGRGTCPKPWAG